MVDADIEYKYTSLTLHDLSEMIVSSLAYFSKERNSVFLWNTFVAICTKLADTICALIIYLQKWHAQVMLIYHDLLNLIREHFKLFKLYMLFYKVSFFLGHSDYSTTSNRPLQVYFRSDNQVFSILTEEEFRTVILIASPWLLIWLGHPKIQP